MATVALNTAATGLSALSTQLDVIANNLANINTDGFKASRVNFEDLLYQVKMQPGVENAIGDQRPMGEIVGTGVRVSGTQLDLRQGELVPTERELDVAIEGKGFFQVRTLPDQGNGLGYTRAGNFTENANGELVLGTATGPRLEPPVVIPDDAQSVTITDTGEVFALLDGDVQPTQIGQFELATFVNPWGLEQIGGNLLIETAASGPPIEGLPGEGQFGTLVQGFLEASNVEPTRELVSLIETQRAFELNAKVIEAADETLQVISNLQRF